MDPFNDYCSSNTTTVRILEVIKRTQKDTKIHVVDRRYLPYEEDNRERPGHSSQPCSSRRSSLRLFVWRCWRDVLWSELHPLVESASLHWEGLSDVGSLCVVPMKPWKTNACRLPGLRLFTPRLLLSTSSFAQRLTMTDHALMRAKR